MSAPHNQPIADPNRAPQPPPNPQVIHPCLPIHVDQRTASRRHHAFFNTVEHISALNANETVGNFGYNRIHQLFCRARFPSLTDAEYQVMVKPCRLASEFILTMPAVFMMYDMMNFRCDDLGTGPATGRRLIMLNKHPRPEHGEPPSDHTWSAVTEGLIALANHIEIRIEVQSSAGTTRLRKQYIHHHTPWDGAHFDPMFGSDITLSAEVFDRLKGFKDARDSGNPYHTAHEVYWIFEMANVLIHETAHALWNATGVKQRGYAEPFYGPEGLLSELGFELQSQIFGGVVGLQRFGGPGEDVAWYGNSTDGLARGGGKGIICLELPPFRSRWKLYAALGHPLEVRQPLPVREEIVRVDFDLIHHFFQKSSWDVCDEDGLGGRTQDLFDLADEGIASIDVVYRDTRYGVFPDVVGLEQPYMNRFWTKPYPE